METKHTPGPWIVELLPEIIEQLESTIRAARRYGDGILLGNAETLLAKLTAKGK